ncbi:MAG: 50S ribosomal protein L10 [Acidobacteria bacterium]|nr:50S ribosomal protein L10 [Acidobacteriota bacterium]
MNKAQKQELIQGLHREFQNLRNAFVIHYKGLKVLQDTELRRVVRRTSSRYRVLKNSLAIRAAEDTRVSGLRPYLDGPTAIAYNDKDPVLLAKALVEFARFHPAVSFKVGMVGGKLIPADRINEIAALPSRDELLALLVGILQRPVSQLVGTLQAPLQQLAFSLEQIKK